MKYPVDGWSNDEFNWTDAGREVQAWRRGGIPVSGTIVIIDSASSGELTFGLRLESGDEIDLVNFDAWKFADEHRAG